MLYRRAVPACLRVYALVGSSWCWRWRICTVLRGAWAKIKLDGLRQRPATATATATFPRRRTYASLPGARMRLTRTSLLSRSTTYSTSSYVAPSDDTGRGTGTGTGKSEQSTRMWIVQQTLTMTMTRYMYVQRTESLSPVRCDQHPPSAVRASSQLSAARRRRRRLPRKRRLRELGGRAGYPRKIELLGPRRRWLQVLGAAFPVALRDSRRRVPTFATAPWNSLCARRARETALCRAKEDEENC